MNEQYVQGFMDKCAEAGVDPEALVKQSISMPWTKKDDPIARYQDNIGSGLRRGTLSGIGLGGHAGGILGAGFGALDGARMGALSSSMSSTGGPRVKAVKAALMGLLGGIGGAAVGGVSGTAAGGIAGALPGAAIGVMTGNAKQSRQNKQLQAKPNGIGAKVKDTAGKAVDKVKDTAGKVADKAKSAVKSKTKSAQDADTVNPQGIVDPAYHAKLLASTQRTAVKPKVPAAPVKKPAVPPAM